MCKTYSITRHAALLLMLFATLSSVAQQSKQGSLWEEFERKHDQVAAARIDSVFSDAYLNRNFNGVVLVSRGGKQIYHKAFGYADVNHNRRNDTNTVFELASVSKQFTAVAILMLYEQDKLELDDSLQRFFPNFPYRGITLHHLLCHRSGLPEYMDFADNYWRNAKQLMTNQDVLEMLTQFMPHIDFLPDQQFAYCNTNYALLALVVEKVSGMRFSEFLNRNIFQPLGMYHTYLFPDNPRNALAAVGHDKAGKRRDIHYQCGIVGDKGVMTTASDMLKWDRALYNCTLLSEATIAMAMTPKFAWLDGTRSYGYGWRLTKLPKKPVHLVFHGGLWCGFNNNFVRQIEDKSTYIVLSNYANGSHYGKTMEILNFINW